MRRRRRLPECSSVAFALLRARAGGQAHPARHSHTHGNCTSLRSSAVKQAVEALELSASGTIYARTIRHAPPAPLRYAIALSGRSRVRPQCSTLYTSTLPRGLSVYIFAFWRGELDYCIGYVLWRRLVPEGRSDSCACSNQPCWRLRAQDRMRSGSIKVFCAYRLVACSSFSTSALAVLCCCMEGNLLHWTALSPLICVIPCCVFRNVQLSLQLLAQCLGMCFVVAAHSAQALVARC
jgi:hypothetical protein